MTKGIIISDGLTIGCDPEIFITRDSKKFKGRKYITGSERVIGDEPIKANNGVGSVVRDGVQVELHPTPSYCRALLGNYLQGCFQALRDQLAKDKTEKLSADFSQVVRVSKAELNRLSEESRKLGCLPSENLYGAPSLKIKGIVQTRSAAGHIHIGSHYITNKTITPEEIVPLLDILLGNLSVLIDRDPLAAKRRKMYGRAGEYRLPPHGLEYRTLSNYWLRSYQLMSFVTGMTKLIFYIAATKQYMDMRIALTKKDPRNYPAYYIEENKRVNHTDLHIKLLEASNMKNVEKAINKNDFDLAMDNYLKVRPILATVSSPYGLSHDMLDDFDYFVKQGVDHWFTEDPMTHWCNKPDGHGHGWESFLAGKVRKERSKA